MTLSPFTNHAIDGILGQISHQWRALLSKPAWWHQVVMWKWIISKSSLCWWAKSNKIKMKNRLI